MAYDGANHSTVLFGGASTSQIYGDTWIWRLGGTSCPQATSPSPRLSEAIAYDAAAGNGVLFGGTTSNVPPDARGNSFNDTWTWDGTTWT